MCLFNPFGPPYLTVFGPVVSLLQYIVHYSAFKPLNSVYFSAYNVCILLSCGRPVGTSNFGPTVLPSMMKPSLSRPMTFLVFTSLHFEYTTFDQ